MDIPAGARLRMRRALRKHAYQPEEIIAPYLTRPPVCSCGASPPSRPARGDYLWWIDHLLKEMQ